MADPSQLGEYLRARGHRLTPPRRAVWAVLEAAEGHLTADQIATRANENEAGINLASIYRSLSLFAELGLARETNLSNESAARWEIAHPDDEFHLICESCGGVDHHGGDLVDRIRHHLGNDHGFEASRVELAVSGQCATCREARAVG